MSKVKWDLTLPVHWTAFHTSGKFVIHQGKGEFEFWSTKSLLISVKILRRACEDSISFRLRICRKHF